MSKLSQFVQQAGDVSFEGSSFHQEIFDDANFMVDVERGIRENYPPIVQQSGEFPLVNGIIQDCFQHMLLYSAMLWIELSRRHGPEHEFHYKHADVLRFSRTCVDNFLILDDMTNKFEEYNRFIPIMTNLKIIETIAYVKPLLASLDAILQGPQQQGGILGWTPTVNIRCPDFDKFIGDADQGTTSVLSELKDVISSISQPMVVKHTMDNPLANFNIWDFLNEHKVVVAVIILCYIGALAIYAGGPYETAFNILCGIGLVYFISDTWMIDWLSSLKDWVMSKISKKEAIVVQGGDLFKDTVSTIAMTGLMGCMFKNLKSTTVTGLVEEFFNKNANLRRVNDGMSFTIEYFLQLLQTCANWVSKVGNLRQVKIVDDPFWEVSLFGAEVSLKRKEYTEDPLRDSVFAGELSQLRSQGEELRSKISRMPNCNHQMSALSLHLKEVSDLINDLNSKLITVNGTRPEPYMLLLMGNAGIGKSSFCNAIWPEITAEVLPNEKLQHFHDHQGEYVHPFNQSDDFYSGYLGQMNFLVDEFAFKKDVAGAPSIFADFIQWVNVNSMNLNMADLNSKGRIYFRSKMIWATSNRKHFRDIDSICEKKAVYRRLKNSFVTAVRVEYATEATQHLSAWERAADFDKIADAGIDDFDYLEFFLVTNIETGEFSNVSISVSDLKEQILGQIASNNATHGFLTNRINSKVKAIVERRLKATKQAGAFCGKCPSCCKDSFIRKNETPREFLARSGLFQPNAWRKSIGGVSITPDVLGPLIQFFRTIPSTAHERTFTDCVDNAFDEEDYAHSVAYHSERNRVRNQMEYEESTMSKVIWYAKMLGIALSSTWVIAKIFKYAFKSLFGVEEPVERQDGYPLHKSKNKGKPKTKLQKARYVLAQGGGDDPNAQQIIAKLVTRNVWRFTIPTGNKTSYQGCVLVLQNDLVLMPEHYLNRWMDIVNGDEDEGIEPDHDVQITFTSCTYKNHQSNEKKNHTFTRTLKDMLNTFDEDGRYNSDFIKITNNIEDDVGVLYIPGITGRKISHLFRSRDQKLPTQHKGTLGLCNRDFAQVYHSSAYKVRDNIVYADGSWGCEKALIYDIPTKMGDCGSPFVIHDKSSEAKIASIHVAGIGNQQGIGCVIDREGVEAGVRTACQMYDIMIDIGLESVHPDVKKMIKDDIVVTQGGPVYEASAKPIPQASKTKLTPSPIHNLIKKYPSAKLPAMLNKKNGVDPMVNAMWGYGVSNIRPNMHLYRAAVDDYSELLFSSTYKITPEFNRVLSFEEAVKGIPGEEFLDGINRKTSPGWPMKHILQKGSKKAAFGEIDYEFSSKDCVIVRDHVAHLESCILNGIRPYVVNNHFLKDELRTAPKSISGKTRLISSADLIFSISLRKHTLMFCAFVMRTRIENGICIGVNPYSDEWSALAAYHGGNAPNYRAIAGDFSGYDKCLAPEEIRALKPLMDRFYNDYGSNTHKIRSALIDEMAHSRHLVNGRIYSWMGSNTSGNVITWLVNSASGNFLHRYAIVNNAPRKITTYHDAREFLKEMNKFVRISQSGDDVLLSVQTNGPFDFITQQYLTESYEKIGMVFTDEDKSLTQENQDRRLDQCTFLKRHFYQTHYLGKRRWMAALSLDTILESIQWTKDHDLDYKFWKDNVKHMQMELSAHPKETYDEWLPRIQAALTAVGYERTVLDTSFRRDLQDKFTSLELVF